MDFPRKDRLRKLKIQRVVYAVVLTAVCGLFILWVSQLSPAAPTARRSSTLISEVRRGTMTVTVRGAGTLIPEQIEWIPASTGGRVKRISALAGTVVTTDTIVVELDNPRVEREALNAELQWNKAKAELEELKIRFEQYLLVQRAQSSRLDAEYRKSQIEAELHQELAQEGLISPLSLKLSLLHAKDLKERHKLHQQELAMNSKLEKARTAAKEAELQQLYGLYLLRKSQVRELKVRAGTPGVIQNILIELGQLVAAGEVLGKVAIPGRLKAQLRIPERQVNQVQVGLPAYIDTGNSSSPGRVARIHPTAQGGSVIVDICLTGPSPPEARPALNIEGKIEISSLDNVLSIRRPLHVQENSTVALYKLTTEGNQAVLTEVRLGRSSITEIEIVDGLAEGDNVILSDTSQWNGAERLELF